MLACGSVVKLSTQSQMQLPPHITGAPPLQPRRRRSSSAGSHRHQLQGKGQAAVDMDRSSQRRESRETGAALSFLPINAGIEPGSKEWSFCSLPLDQELAQGLAHKWPTIEATYKATLKKVFWLLRRAREATCHYFHRSRCVSVNSLVSVLQCFPSLQERVL